ncbi:SDR family oxidoreductase [Saccharopolyspora karakumensis]|uniref:SDR family oxidoreductase n=1 Tax=Saccharopolyspora karakumensis TaxID=2530386 RepID=A0A4R5BBI2_9PSEU|nr:SDR family NAD(P)-dependent oxidoreductase [Saccharopolyspora karakumensis]TDD82026.1 SDR family oxidoreductase [Saccharopolyspora karakumensis]
MRVDGAIAVVTGAASGMGLATAKALTDAGATVYGIDLRREALDEEFAQLPRARGFALDVSDSAAINEVFGRLEADHGKLDVLVNAAGVSTPGGEQQAWVDGINDRMVNAAKTGETFHPEFLNGITDADFDRVVAINLNGTFYTIRAAVELLKKAGGGSIVNFASVAGLIGLPMPAYYPASKAAIVGLTKAVAAELAPFDIRVNALAPAGVNTAMLSASGDDHVQALLALQPLKRVAEPDEVGRTVLFLASDAGKHFTGQTLSPSGGALMA